MDSDSFAQYAIDRISRSGVIIDPIFTQFIYDPRCRYIETKDVDRDKYFLCYGNESMIFLLEVQRIVDQKKLHKIPISRIWPKKNYYDILDKTLDAKIFTPIPNGYYTSYECEVWFRNNPEVLERIRSIAGK